MSTFFRVTKRDKTTCARCGLLQTSHGDIETPVFMPVGTAATVKAMPHELLEQLDPSIILSNTYHLYLRPGQEVISAHGGLHQFMSWNRPVLTDSGGYQVFSHRALRKISEDGVDFRSHLDGSSHFFSPEKAIYLQQVLGSDIMMVLDDCTPYPVTEQEARDSMLRSMRWAKRCEQVPQSGEQALFGIVQGSVFLKLREESLEHLSGMNFQGIALGGFSVGEPRPLMYEIIEHLSGLMREDKPRYVMGVGMPQDLFFCVKQGMDMFDCVLPTRNARNGTLFTSLGPIKIKNARYRFDQKPLDPHCTCLVCRRYTRSYLRHLYISGEIVAGVLNTYHNLHFYLDLMHKIRQSIALNSLTKFEEKFNEQYAELSDI